MVKAPDFNLHLGGELPPCFTARQLWNRSSAQPRAKPSMPGVGIRRESIYRSCDGQMGDHGDVIK